MVNCESSVLQLFLSSESSRTELKLWKDIRFCAQRALMSTETLWNSIRSPVTCKAKHTAPQEILLNSPHLNGHTQGFCPPTQKLEFRILCSVINSTTGNLYFKALIGGTHLSILSTSEKVKSTLYCMMSLRHHAKVQCHSVAFISHT